MATWSKARATFGDGTPAAGGQFDDSSALRQLQSDVEAAAPGSSWTGSAADGYDSTNQRHARALGDTASLDQRLRVEIDRSAAVVASGRRELDAVREWVANAASSVPPTAQGERMLYPVVSKGSGEIADILQRSNSDMNAIAGRVNALGAEYRAIGGDFKLDRPGGPLPEGPDAAIGDRDNPWQYPFDPPPPPDSAPGGGRWELGQGYPPGPGGGPPMGPIASPQPWQRAVQPPVVGGTSGLQDVVAPPPNGWGVKPPAVLQEAYRFRVVGETFTGADNHVRWIQRDGQYYQAHWVDYNLQAEHVQQLTGKISLPWGMNQWQDVGIKDVYQLQTNNPRLTLYVPTPAGGQFVLDPHQAGLSLPR